MSSFFISYKQSSIHCFRWGEAKDILLCLHGFGETAESFTSLARQLEHRYTIIAIDMPLHGKTIWKEGMTCTPEDIIGIIDHIPGVKHQRFSLAGYSMGGRVALSVYGQITKRIQQLILLAPDGIKINFWYWLATQTFYGNRLFRYFMKQPGIFLSATRLLKKSGLINLGVYNYVHQYLNVAENREQLYTIWTTYRKCKPPVNTIRKQIKMNNTSVLLIYGKYDRIIRYSTGKQFSKGLGESCTIHILECGHRLLQHKNIPGIAALLF